MSISSCRSVSAQLTARMGWIVRTRWSRVNQCTQWTNQHDLIASVVLPKIKFAPPHDVLLLLFPVPRSIIMCLLRKKNMTVHGSYSSYLEERDSDDTGLSLV